MIYIYNNIYMEIHPTARHWDARQCLIISGHDITNYVVKSGVHRPKYLLIKPVEF